MVSFLEAIRQARSAQVARETTKVKLAQAREGAKDIVNKPAKGFFDAVPKPADFLFKRQQIKETAIKPQSAPMVSRQKAVSNKPNQTLRLPAITQLPAIQRNKPLAKFLKGLGF
jgi:hypothetical protein